MNDTSSYVLLAVVWGIVCYVMAGNRGRNQLLGIAGGLAFGFITVIYYWIAGDTREKKLEKAELLVKNSK
jgi:hypothetical protein